MKYPIRLRRYVRLRRQLFARSCALVVILTILAVQLIHIATD
jgi:hypothetical protein